MSLADRRGLFDNRITFTGTAFFDTGNSSFFVFSEVIDRHDSFEDCVAVNTFEVINWHGIFSYLYFNIKRGGRGKSNPFTPGPQPGRVPVCVRPQAIGLYL